MVELPRPFRGNEIQIPSPHVATNPMRFVASRHSTSEVNFLGTKITGTTPGQDALHIALDRLFYHDNTGPFFARQMIQRLVTSNPTPAYVQRVATVFGNNGSGVRGDLKAVWTAILTDEEARAMPTAGETLFGKMREPIVRFVHWARTAEVTSDNGEFEVGNLSEADNMLGQSPLRSPSVFNFFRPGYVPPNTDIATAGKVAPEFQLHNETSTSGYINFMQRVTRAGIRDVKPGYTTLLPIAHDVAAVVDWLNLRLTANQLSSETLAVLSTTLRTFNITAESSGDAKLDMVADGLLPHPDFSRLPGAEMKAPKTGTNALWTRRLVLQRAVQLSAMGMAVPLAINLAAIGEAAAFDATDYKALVCVFLHGGNDYANTVVPYDPTNYAQYHQLRAGTGGEDQAGIALARADLAATALTPVDGAVLTDGLQYALAPQLVGLKQLFDSGRLAIQLNVGPLIQPTTLMQYQSSNRAANPLPPKLFSHNDQQSLWQSDGSEGSTSGWGGRLGDIALSAGPSNSQLTCISAGNNAVFVAGRDALQYQISGGGAVRIRALGGAIAKRGEFHRYTQ